MGISHPQPRVPDRKSGPGRALRTAAGLALAAPLALALVGGLTEAGAAEAHDNQVSGVATCTTDGTYTVTWTVANDYDLTDTVKVTAATGKAPALSPSVIPASKGKPYNTATATQTLPGDTTSASITIDGTWADNFHRTDTNTLALDGTCQAPTLVTSAGSAAPSAPASSPAPASPAAASSPVASPSAPVSSPAAASSPPASPAAASSPPASPAAATPASSSPDPTTSSSPVAAAPAVDAPVCPTPPFTGISYAVNGNTGQADLTGVQMGQHVVVRFTVPAGCPKQTFSLVAYQAPASTFDAATASQQTLVGHDTKTVGPGTYTLAVTAPSCNFQIDFILGEPIAHLDGNSYSKAGQLISSVNGGGRSCTPPTTPPTDPTPTPPTTPPAPPVVTPPVTNVLGVTYYTKPVTVPTATVLPFTGNNTVLLVEIGGALVGLGLVLRGLGGRRRVRG